MNTKKINVTNWEVPIETTIKMAAIQFISAKAVDKAHTTIKRYQNVLDHLFRHFGESYQVNNIDNNTFI